MTTASADNHPEQKQVRLADEPAGKSSQDQNEPGAEVNAAAADLPAHVSVEPEVEVTTGDGQNGNGGAEAEMEANGAVEDWPDETAETGSIEGEGATAAVATEAPESVAEKLKNKLRRKTSSPEIKKLQADFDKALSDNEALRDKYLRLAAEFDNYRKRIDRDFNQRVQSAFAELVTELLPVLDDLERSLNTKPDQQNYDSLQNGVHLIQQKFAKVLAERGVEPIQVVGAEFDPNLHDALTEMAMEGKPAGLVLEEQTRGYTYRDRVLRPAKVIVSK